MNIAIVEDETQQAKALRTLLEQYGSEHQLDCSIKWYQDAMDFLEGYQPQFDLVFMDIEMPYLNGLKAAAELRRKDTEVCLVFVTNLAKYAVKGYAVNASDYLIKPVSYAALSFCMDRVLRVAGNRRREEVLLQSNRAMLRVRRQDIYYIETQGHQVIYHTANGSIETWDSMKTVRERFGSDFASPRTGVLVNMRHVDKIEGNSVFVHGEELLIARPKKSEFLNAFTVYFTEM